jgi:hypothetical protein
MKIRNHIARSGVLLMFAACMVLADSALAQQQFPFEGPYTPVIASPMYRGRWYFQAGVKVRNLNSFRFTGDPHLIQYIDPGVAPFGPDDLTAGGCGLPPFCPIPFGTGTGRTGLQAFPINAPCITVFTPPGDPRITGAWFYQNGKVDARDPVIPGPGDTCADPGPPPVTVVCFDGTNCWRDLPLNPERFLGRYVLSGGSGAPCCATTPVSRLVGSFIVQDASTQANEPTSFAGTTRVSFQWVIDGTYNSIIDPFSGATSTSGEVQSRVFSFDGLTFSNLEFRETILTPDFEMGVQVADYFSLFAGFSCYKLGRETTKTNVTPVDFGRRGFTDTFSFVSDDAGGWTLPFASADTIANGDGTQTYTIAPDGIAQGQYPTRLYFLTTDFNLPQENMQETISHRADLETYEFRLGGRSWFPLFGMGSFGVSVGAIGNIINYRLFGSRTVVSLGPTVPGLILETPLASEKNMQFKFGGFLGSDLEVLLQRGCFVRGSVQYSLSDQFRAELLSVYTNFDPGGFSWSVAGGFRF